MKEKHFVLSYFLLKFYDELSLHLSPSLLILLSVILCGSIYHNLIMHDHSSFGLLLHGFPSYASPARTS